MSVNVDNLSLPNESEFRRLRKRWRIARSLLRYALRVTSELFRREGVPNWLKDEMLYQRSELLIALNNLDLSIPTNHQPLAEELDNMYETEETVDANIDCLNMNIQGYHSPLPLIVDNSQ